MQITTVGPIGQERVPGNTACKENRQGRARQAIAARPVCVSSPIYHCLIGMEAWQRAFTGGASLEGDTSKGTPPNRPAANTDNHRGSRVAGARPPVDIPGN